ncbi:hypothetical protein Alches_00470 [Alicyclobacillus hesperidum subsp. aegles]|uniref:RluA family pseudouridine synthase n=1 Tax=Alicyclobacillus hesperidum TaxID=89784 RepID=UPI00222A6458|nr:RluA family pseudouridine synthase [Alicyclobacillus hesperidum]GLG00008.1 hypothetical protein Alches_00470 [Alicyclobacillus hesperidum subsp. aegles]
MEVQFRSGVLSIRLDKASAGWPVERFLSERLGLPHGFINQLFHRACVTYNRDRAKPADELAAGGRLLLADPTWGRPTTREITSSNAPELAVLYEDDHVLVVNKPAGLIIHTEDPTVTALDDIVAGYLAQRDGQGLHVHRLDGPTTGAVLYAKHTFMLRALDAQLVNKAIQRSYVAITWGRRLSNGVIDQPIGRDRHQRGKFRVASTGKPARTHVTVLAVREQSGMELSLVQLQLATGRTHQIRVHLSAQGAPIVGDAWYGGTTLGNWPAPGQIALHAASLRFWHPYDERWIDIHAPFDAGWCDTLLDKFGLAGEFILRE